MKIGFKTGAYSRENDPYDCPRDKPALILEAENGTDRALLVAIRSLRDINFGATSLSALEIVFGEYVEE